MITRFCSCADVEMMAKMSENRLNTYLHRCAALTSNIDFIVWGTIHPFLCLVIAGIQRMFTFYRKVNLKRRKRFFKTSEKTKTVNPTSLNDSLTSKPTPRPRSVPSLDRTHTPRPLRSPGVQTGHIPLSYVHQYQRYVSHYWLMIQRCDS